MKWALALPLLAVAAVAQSPPDGVLPPAELDRLAVAAAQLIESTAAAVPELPRAAAPLLQNARQAREDLRRRPASAAAARALANAVRAYLAVADATPKPRPFPEEARRQFLELRELSGRLAEHFDALVDRKEAAEQPADPDAAARYREANQTLPPPSPANPRIVFFGDSITEFWRLNEYFPGRDFVNRGIAGQVTGQMLGRFYADAVRLKPAAIVLLAGTNDIARGTPLAVIADHIVMMADLARANGIPLILASVLPVSDYHAPQNPQFERTPVRPPGSLKALNDWLQRFAQQRGYLYVDYHAALVDAAGQLREDCSGDGLHPNALGYRLMAPLALQAIDKAVPPAQQKVRKNRQNED
jgi:lysophospholipase L1-like esterase